MIGPDGTPAGLIAALHVLREQATIVQAALVARALTTQTAGLFAASCDQAARAILDHVERQGVLEIEPAEGAS